jgi:hypothetical protein
MVGIQVLTSSEVKLEANECHGGITLADYSKHCHD